MTSKSPRAALWWWYHGHAFRGYQSQLHHHTVQDTIASLLRKLSLEASPVASGRTDAGVHARMQVQSCRFADDLNLKSIEERLADLCPEGLGLVSVQPAHPKFHAHFSLSAKVYRYRIVRSALLNWSPFAWECSATLDLDKVTAMLQRCVGTHRFDAFHDKSSSLTPRTIDSLRCLHRPDGVCEIEFVGQGFARYQVRFLVGAAVQVALKERSEDDFLRALRHQENRHFTKAPAHGLTLWSVEYPTDSDPFHGLRPLNLAEAGCFASQYSNAD